MGHAGAAGQNIEEDIVNNKDCAKAAGLKLIRKAGLEKGATMVRPDAQPAALTVDAVPKSMSSPLAGSKGRTARSVSGSLSIRGFTGGGAQPTAASIPGGGSTKSSLLAANKPALSPMPTAKKSAKAPAGTVTSPVTADESPRLGS